MTATKPPAKTTPAAAARDRDVRLRCLEIAVVGVGFPSAEALIARARALEDYVIGGGHKGGTQP